MGLTLSGRARRFGDDINADYIITSARKRDTLDPAELSRYLMETLDPAFAATVRSGDVLVAGRNFGCGSAMEVAATVILGAGIKAVIAHSFSRTFYRNAVNNGLLPVECDTSGMAEGQGVEIDLAGKSPRVTNRTTGQWVAAGNLPAIMRDILEAGGLVGYVRRNGGFGDGERGAVSGER